MESGKTYDGFIDTSIPQAMIDMINKPENSAIIDQLLTPYINVAEVATPTLFSGLAVSEYKAGGNGGSYGSKGESTADAIKARQEAVKALVASFYGEYTMEKYLLALGDQAFIIAMSFELGLALPSNLSLSF